MGKNKLAKFDDMAGYPHVFQYPFAALQEQGFEMEEQQQAMGSFDMDVIDNEA